MEPTYLGHNINYWLELQKKAEELNIVNWLDEVAELRAKVSSYESRLDEINKFKNRKDGTI